MVRDYDACRAAATVSMVNGLPPVLVQAGGSPGNWRTAGLVSSTQLVPGCCQSSLTFRRLRDLAVAAALVEPARAGVGVGHDDAQAAACRHRRRAARRRRAGPRRSPCRAPRGRPPARSRTRCRAPGSPAPAAARTWPACPSAMGSATSAQRIADQPGRDPAVRSAAARHCGRRRRRSRAARARGRRPRDRRRGRPSWSTGSSARPSLAKCTRSAMAPGIGRRGAAERRIERSMAWRLSCEVGAV